MRVAQFFFKSVTIGKVKSVIYIYTGIVSGLFFCRRGGRKEGDGGGK